MKIHTRDRLTTILGIAILSLLVGASYYYAIKTEMEVTRTEANKDSPDFITHNICITSFKEDGTTKNRFFADYAEHFSDGRTLSINPRYVSLDVQEPQMKLSANKAVSRDDGETTDLSGDVVLTRSGDANHAPLRVTTNQARVYPDTGIVTSEVLVRIENGSDSHSGVGLRYDNVDRTLELMSNVHTTVIPKNTKK